MSDHLFGIVELVFVFTVVLGFGIWQLYTVKRRDPPREKKDDDEDKPAR